MQDEKIYNERIKRWIDRLSKEIYPENVNLHAEYICDEINPIKPDQFNQYEWKNIKVKEQWGKTWNCSWFIFKGRVPEHFAGKEVGAYIDIQGEACVFRNTDSTCPSPVDMNKSLTPYIGLTNKIDWDHRSGKYYVPLFSCAQGGEDVFLLAEGGANGLFGKDKDEYCLDRADIVVFDREKYELYTDVRALHSIFEGLSERSVRRRRILSGLNKAVNVYQNGEGIKDSLAICKELLSVSAGASALNVWSIGHAHIDLGWLWPVRETKRKGSRTFSTVLRMMEEYPEYKFGASQAQLYQWMKDLYPELYNEMKQKIKEKRWECQGATWVENDTNMPGGESLIRQFIYGKKFYRDEFGVDVNYLWLPDCFGFTGSLPQIMKHCQVDYFVSQKLSWNEINTFPHHTFIWKGVDGSEIKTHFVPTNDYNFSNMPNQMMQAESRFAQADIAEDFLNLYGIGDGGGGPSRDHIEMALRQKDTDGVSKVKMAFAGDFLKTLDALDSELLPVWQGELYFELHRGTYTTQSRMKRYNRLLETRLQQVEFLSALYQQNTTGEIEEIWKDTLLNQFHDIIPGSSIGWVYKDAHALSEENLEKLNLIQKSIFSTCGDQPEHTIKLVVNTQPWERTEVVLLDSPKTAKVYDENDRELPSCYQNGLLSVMVKISAFSVKYLKISNENSAQECTLGFNEENVLENTCLRVELDEQGCICRIFDKQENREVLKGKANYLQLWEDLPNNWGAWDVNHFYRETMPEQAQLIGRRIIVQNGFIKTIEQMFRVGQSEIAQKISLCIGSKMIKIENKVKWNEKHKMLRVSAEPAVQSMNARSEIQFGLIDRPTHQNTSWDRAKFEVLAHKFIDLSQPDYGFAVINDCKYGHSVMDGILEINLLRSPADVDPEADIATHHFSYAYYPHNQDLTRSDVVKKAHCFNSPLIVCNCREIPAHIPTLPFEFETNTIKIDTVKNSFNINHGITLRMYETVGANDRIVFTLKHDSEVFLCDALEENLIPVDVTDNCFSLHFKPFEIKTLIIG